MLVGVLATLVGAEAGTMPVTCGTLAGTHGTLAGITVGIVVAVGGSVVAFRYTIHSKRTGIKPVLLLWGERRELNPRPPGPQSGALTN